MMISIISCPIFELLPFLKARDHNKDLFSFLQLRKQIKVSKNKTETHALR